MQVKNHRMFWNFVYLVWGVEDTINAQHRVSNRQFLSIAEWYDYYNGSYPDATFVV